jgi:hypothetical protein
MSVPHATRAVRRVGLASLMGITIEYYDFFIYGTAAFFPGLRKGLLPHLRPARRNALVVRHLRRRVRCTTDRGRALRRQGRAKDNSGHHIGDNGSRNCRSWSHTVVRLDWYRRADPSRRTALHPGHCSGWRVRRRGPHDDRAQPGRQARLLRILGPDRRSIRPHRGQRRLPHSRFNRRRRDIQQPGVGAFPSGSASCWSFLA